MAKEELMKFEITSKKNSIILPTDKFILKSNFTEIEIDAEEYSKIDLMLQAINAGKISPDVKVKIKRTGEWVSLQHFSYLIRKKSSNPKVFGEDIEIK